MVSDVNHQPGEKLGLKTGCFQILCAGSNSFVGHGFSHDMKSAISVSALAPEDLKRSYHTDSFSPEVTLIAALPR